jgi:transcription antitermination factor NusG
MTTSSTQTPALAWYVLAVATRREQAVAQALSSWVEVFVPVRIERRVWSDRVRTREVALFPSYVFVRLALTPHARVQLLRQKGVLDVVGRGVDRDIEKNGIAPAVADATVEDLMRLVQSARALDPVSELLPGRQVVVAAGSLKGVRGVVEEGTDGQRRLVVQVALLGRGVRTVLSADDVLLAPEAAQGA